MATTKQKQALAKIQRHFANARKHDEKKAKLMKQIAALDKASSVETWCAMALMKQLPVELLGTPEQLQQLRAELAEAEREADATILDRAAYRRKHGCVAEPPTAAAAKAGGQ